MEPLEGELKAVDINNAMDQDAMMSIDTNYSKDDLIAFVLYIVVVISTTLAGIFGPRHFYPGTTQVSFANPNDNMISKAISSITPEPREVLLAIQPARNNDQKLSKIQFAFTYVLVFKMDSVETNRISKVINTYAHFKGTETNAKSIIFYYNRNAEFNELHVSIIFNQTTDLTGASLEYRIGETNYHQFVTRIRLVFTCVCTITIALFIMRLKTYPLRHWTFEQIMTLILHCAAILGTNPFSIVFSEDQYPWLDACLYACFKATKVFFILSVYDHATNKVFEHNPLFFAPKIFLALLMFVFTLLSTAFNTRIESFGTAIMQPPLFKIGKIGALVSNLLFICNFIYLVVKAIRNIDPSEQHKTIIYTVLFILVIILECLEGLMGEFPLMAEKTGSFAYDFSLNFTFVIIMAFFHWPYKAAADEQYNNLGQENQTPGDFFGKDLVDPEQQEENQKITESANEI